MIVKSRNKKRRCTGTSFPYFIYILRVTALDQTTFRRRRTAVQERQLHQPVRNSSTIRWIPAHEHRVPDSDTGNAQNQLELMLKQLDSLAAKSFFEHQSIAEVYHGHERHLVAIYRTLGVGTPQVLAIGPLPIFV